MCLYLKYLVRPSKWRVEIAVSGSLYFFLFQRKLYILFSISFLIYIGKVQIWPMYHSLEKMIWFTIIFLPLKQSLTLFQIWIFFAIPSLILSHLDLAENRVTKINFKHFNGNCDYSSCSG